jgi:pimeloyl-ACP methyl ester carboxylesterase
LLHGFGEDGSVWKFQETFLAPCFRLIIPDLPGSGRSSFLPMAGTLPADIISDYADIIKRIAEKEAVRHCILIGHSMGGYIALAFAAKYENMLAGLGLVHSTAYADSAEKKEARSKGIAFIQKHGAQEFLKQSIPNLFGDAFKAARPEAVQELIDKAANFSVAALVQYYEAMMGRPDSITVLRNIKKPVLFIIGEEDKSVYLQDSLSQCYLPVLSLINILPQVAHMGMWEMKDRTNATIIQFLNYCFDD